MSESIKVRTREKILEDHERLKYELLEFYYEDPAALMEQIEKLTFRTAELLDSIGDRYSYDSDRFTNQIRSNYKGTSQ
jgi:hypothetical protein